MAKRTRVVLLFGGRSAEHDVSRVTAVSVAKALDPTKYDVIPVAITTDGAWLHANEAAALLDGARDALPKAFSVQGTPLVAPTDPNRAQLTPLDGTPSMSIDVVLPLLHGPYGEDGTVQGLLELAGLPYVGSGVLGSAVCMDKRMMKQALRASGLPVARDVIHRDGHDVVVSVEAAERDLGYPMFVKPANMGSSVGVSKACDRDELVAALDLATGYDEWVLIEEMIGGREIEVAILGDDPPRASVPGEIVPGAEFYSYADKYESDAAELHAPARISAEATTEVRELAIAAFAACGCEAMARVDFFYETESAIPERGPRGFVVNELNTIPGFTPISMYPRLWAESGLAYPQLLDELIVLAQQRHARRAARAGKQR